MLETFRGSIRYYKSLGRGAAQFEIKGIPLLIELYTCEAWVLNDGDIVRIAGERMQSGKFIAYAYVNETRGVRGNASCDRSGSIIFIIGGIVFCWAIFPLFTHLTAGIRGLAFCRKVRQSVEMLHR